jgi:hypothetical protein
MPILKHIVTYCFVTACSNKKNKLSGLGKEGWKGVNTVWSTLKFQSCSLCHVMDDDVSRALL